jgi:hypothetical protein
MAVFLPDNLKSGVLQVIQYEAGINRTYYEVPSIFTVPFCTNCSA